MRALTSAWLERGRASWRRVLDTPRIRGEVGWVFVTKFTELVLLFGLLKVLTTRLGKEQYGEYSLAEATVFLVAGLLLSPVHESFLRDLHGATERGERRAAALLVLRWYAIATLSAATLVGLSSELLARWFEVGRFTPLAAGLVLVFERWRFLAADVLNVERRRRRWALHNISYFAAQLATIGAAVHWIRPTATTALCAYAGTAAVFGAPMVAALVGDTLRRPPGRPTALPGLVRSFGIPYAALLFFQLAQGFGDRFLIKAMLDAASVGVYVAAYQVCGVPFVLLLRVFHDLLTPIAYQRGREVGNPLQLWAADRLVLVGIGIQGAIGLAMLGVYALLGQRLLVTMTSQQFALPVTTIVTLAAARFVQHVGMATQPIFAVHHQLPALLRFRVFGALLALAICWRMIGTYGIFGAAAGTLLALCIYSLALVFGPRGCFWLVTDARRRAARIGRAHDAE